MFVCKFLSHVEWYQKASGDLDLHSSAQTSANHKQELRMSSNRKQEIAVSVKLG